MKRTLTVSALVDVRDMAALLKGALTAGVLDTGARVTDPSGVSLANVIKVAVSSTVGALQGQRGEFEHSVTGAWAFLLEHGIGTRQMPHDEEGRPILSVAGLAVNRPEAADAGPPTFNFDEVLEAMGNPEASLEAHLEAHSEPGA